MMHSIQRCIVLAIAFLIVGSAFGDEGMWLFNDLPREHLQREYGFEPTDAWAQHVMHASVRFNSGGSASFVSSTGLVLTNHHVGAETLHNVSTAENNYYRDGFYAKSKADEIKAPDLELNQLVSIEDVTGRVESALKEGMSLAEAFAARRAIMSQIEKESFDKTGLRSDVVALYGGARYHLYRYKKYTDVRLVWAPESAIAFFGGDADNFEYPRYCLDACIFRVYEGGKPAKVEHFLQYSKKGAADGELVFVSGNPGRTQRIFTASALAFQRDIYLPYVLNYLRRREILFQQFGLESKEKERRARDELFGIQNSRKAYTGMLQGLQDPSFLAEKREAEKALLEKVASDPQLASHAEAWKTIEEVNAKRGAMLGQTASFSSSLFGFAETLVFMAAEDLKPNAERLREYRESNRESLNQQLFSAAPIHADLEQLKMADSLALFVERRGGDHELVQRVLAGKSPQAFAAELVLGSKLVDPEFRKKLSEGGVEAIQACTDPMIQLARLMEPEQRRLRAVREELQEMERQAYSQIADILFAVQGTGTYPDATFTLRLAFGSVKGYREKGEFIPPWTTMGGAFEHEQKHGGMEAWKLPESWHRHRDDLKGDVPFNFVCTADIIGGNSGSPVINREGEFVGIIFDGNIQSLTADYFYSDKDARAVSVHSAAILEALRTIYGAAQLADELGR